MRSFCQTKRKNDSEEKKHAIVHPTPHPFTIAVVIFFGIHTHILHSLYIIKMLYAVDRQLPCNEVCAFFGRKNFHYSMKSSVCWFVLLLSENARTFVYINCSGFFCRRLDVFFFYLFDKQEKLFFSLKSKHIVDVQAATIHEKISCFRRLILSLFFRIRCNFVNCVAFSSKKREFNVLSNVMLCVFDFAQSEVKIPRIASKAVKKKHFQVNLKYFVSSWRRMRGKPSTLGV